MVDFRNLLGPTLLRTCSNCAGSGRPVRWPWMSCEPCDGLGLVPNRDGRDLLEVLGPGSYPMKPTTNAGA